MQEGVDDHGGEGDKSAAEGDADLRERLAGVASRAAIVCSYEEEARHVERQSRVLSAHLETLENDRLKGKCTFSLFLFLRSSESSRRMVMVVLNLHVRVSQRCPS
jgi:hypothetical protein